MKKLWIVILCLPSDIMEQRGGDQNIGISFRFVLCNIQCQIQDAIDMLFVMGAVLHALQHIVFQLFKYYLLHRGSLISEKRAYSETCTHRVYCAAW